MGVQLISHPSTTVTPIQAITVEIDWPHADLISLRYVVLGSIADVRLPARRPPARADNLWQSTCFEAFFKRQGEERYLEFNFSPSTEWASYRFDGYRAGMANAEDISAAVTTRLSSDRYELTATASVPPGPWRVALSAVIEAADGAKSYWALAHPPGAPDFHHDDCFALEVPAREDV